MLKMNPQFKNYIMFECSKYENMYLMIGIKNLKDQNLQHCTLKYLLSWYRFSTIIIDPNFYRIIRRYRFINSQSFILHF